MIAEWKRIEEEQRIYDQPVQREAPLVLIEPDTDGSDAVFTWVQLALAAPFPAELDRSQKILHLYGGQEGSSLIDRINRCRAWQQLPFASLEQRRFICWKDSAREYRAIAMSGIRDNAVGATAIELQVNAVYPGLVIFDFPMIPEDTSPIMKFIQLKRRGGTSFWICSRKRVPFPKFCPSVTLTVSGKEGKHGELFLTAKKTEGSALSGAWLRPLHYSLNTAAIPVSRSKYGAKIPLIRELSMAGVKEVDIAQQLGISHATLKQLKRRHGIRVKAPLQRKRRSGLDKEIFRLFDAGVRPDDIAKKLAITPYYVRLRIQKLSKSMQ